jgi:plasmid replication initiation protein
MASPLCRRPRLPRDSERNHLAPFVIATGDAAPRDQRDLMEKPFFSLAKGKRTAPILYEAGGERVEVFAMPEYGMATIWDADILIWAASQIVEAANQGFETSRFFRFMPYQFLRAVGRGDRGCDYERLKAALMRLQSTVVATTIRNGERWRRRQFSWINEWEEMTASDGRALGMEFVLPEWFYTSVIDRSLVLAIDPDYFRLKGGIERWLYRIARKHAGRQPEGWTFEVAHLHYKSGSLARLADFAIDIRRIAARQSLPGYRLDLWRDGPRETLRIRPENLSTVPVDNHVNGAALSGAKIPALSGATADRHFIEESNRESNSWSLARGHARHGAVPPGDRAANTARSIGEISARLPFTLLRKSAPPDNDANSANSANSNAPELPFGRQGGRR